MMKTKLKIVGPGIDEWDLRSAVSGFTTAPIQEGLPGGIPEFTRIKATTAYTGLSRGKIYEGIKEGWVRSVSMRKPGQKFSVRLIHLPSLILHLRKLMKEQNPGAAKNDAP